MNDEEQREWKELLRRCAASGNDGADVYEAEEFQHQMELKYGCRFHDLYFN